MTRPKQLLLVALATAISYFVATWHAGTTAPAITTVVLPDIANVKLTYSVPANEEFREAIKQELRIVQKKLENNLCIPLIAGGAVRPPVGCKPDSGADAVVHAVVLKNSKVWRLFSTAHSLFEEPTSFGSIAKAIVGVPFLVSMGASPSEGWCRKSLANFRNANGDRGSRDCTSGEAWISAKDAIGRSDNLSIAWRLKRSPKGDLEIAIKSAGLHSAPTDYSLAIWLAMGIAEFSPRQVLEAFDALASGTASRAATVDDAFAPPGDLARWTAAIVSDPEKHKSVLAMLAAPVRAGGTAAHLPALLPIDATNVIAKTGTPTNSAGFDTGKALVASFVHKGERYTLLFAVLAPKPSTPLGPKLQTIDFAAVHRAMIQHATKEEK